MPEALNIALSLGEKNEFQKEDIDKEYEKCQALEVLAPYLREENLMSQALDATLSFQVWKDISLKALVPYLSESLIDRAFTTSLASVSSQEKSLKTLIPPCSSAVSILAPYLPKQLLKKVVENFPTIYWSTYYKARFLTAMAPYWPKAREEALKVARTIEKP